MQRQRFRTIARQAIALLLMLLIGLTPVAAAVADCAEPAVAAPGQLSSGSDRSNDSLVAPKRILQDGAQHSHDPDHCRNGGLCLFHVCGGLGLIDTIGFITLPIPLNQPPRFLAASLNTRAIAPELAPPISTIL